MTFDGNKTATLSTGRTFYIFGGYLSISEESIPKVGHFADLVLRYGYDGELLADDDDQPQFTAEEIREIADYAIGLWQLVKEKAILNNTAETQAPS